jgi:hypothetical protein
LARDIPDTEPKVLRCGDSWQWNKVYEDYPASSWTLTYFLYGAAVVDADGFDAAASGDEHQVRQAGSYSESFAAGEYTLVGRVTDGSDIFTIYEDAVELIASASALATSAQKTHAETCYDLLTALIEGKIPKDQESFQINGRAVVRIPIREAMRLRGFYASLIEQERAGGDSLGGPIVEVDFG